MGANNVEREDNATRNVGPVQSNKLTRNGSGGHVGNVNRLSPNSKSRGKKRLKKSGERVIFQGDDPPLLGGEESRPLKAAQTCIWTRKKKKTTTKD